VLKIAENESGVKISTTDKSTYDGHILVGADGAYSAVRQRMYETLRRQTT
jgi:2-polyprenyl-6-methoxyphenol hydroxylase-like FAD-dependent oxidoreductase